MTLCGEKTKGLKRMNMISEMTFGRAGAGGGDWL